MNSSNSVWIVLLMAWIGGSTWWHVCKIKFLCADQPQPVTVEPDFTLPPLHVIDGAALMLASPYNFSFAKSGAKANLTPVVALLDSVAGYLQTSPDKRVIITGLYDQDEINSSSWPNLGIARAEDVKSYYVGKGMSPSLVTTKGALSDDLAVRGDSIFGGIDFHFLDALTLTENTLAEAQKFEDIFKPLDLYFNTGSVDYIQTTDNERFLEEAMLFLSQNKDRVLSLTGHTDNVGSEATNLELSRERAEAVKQALTAAGISPNQIVVDAKGQSSPKVSNDTPEGQAANRRVTIVISK
jgi:OOP family OmpA-OmpF porin